MALSMSMPVFYHLPTVAQSMLAAVFASAIALFVVSRTEVKPWHEALGSLAVGGGIAAMHYVGMAAMRCAAVVVYDERIVALSIGLAVVCAGGAAAGVSSARKQDQLARSSAHW